MLNLPYLPRRVLLFAFWCVFSLTFILVSAMISLIFFPDIPWYWLLVAFLPLLLIGYRYEPVPIFFYRAWNKLDREIGARFSRWLLLVTIYAITCMVSLAGSRLQLARPAGRDSRNSRDSMWSRPPAENEYAAIMKRRAGESGSGPFLHWAVKSGNLWAIWLLPFLLLLLVFQRHEVETATVDSNIYTLF